MKTCIYIICILIFNFCLYSCEKSLNQEVEGVLTIAEATGTEEGLISLLNSSYLALSNGGAYDNAIIKATELASDNGWTEREEYLKTFQSNPSTPELNSIWSSHYAGIARANLVLDNLHKVEFFNEKMPGYIQGQALFLRALFYFNLVRFYGDLPLITKEIKKPEDAAISRSKVEDVYNQIIEDLVNAQSILPSRYDGSGIGLEIGRATTGSATGLLAKVYLSIEEWRKAATEAEKIIDSGIYDLEEDYAQNFQGRNENGKESIFEVQFSDQADGNVGSALSDLLASPRIVQGNGLSFIIPTNDTLAIIGGGATGNGIVQLFDHNDIRKDIAFSTYGLSNQYPLINKYYAGSDSPPNNSAANVPVLRLADILLIYAEAINELGDSVDVDAVHAINRVRKRANLSQLDVSIINKQEEFRDSIRMERRRELAFESERFFDLNRYGTLEMNMQLQGINIDKTKVIAHPITGKSQYLYPIPTVEITTNPNTRQNPGY